MPAKIASPSTGKVNSTYRFTTDAGEVLGRLGLAGHLTQQRSNGFASMIQRIKSDAQQALQA